MSPPPEIRQNSAQQTAAALDRGASLPASPPDVHLPPSPLPERKLMGGSPLSSQIVSTVSTSQSPQITAPQITAPQTTAPTQITARLNPSTPSFAISPSSPLAQNPTPNIATPTPTSALGINRQELFEQRQKMVLAIGRNLERERKTSQQKAPHAKHGAESHLREGLLVRLLQALGLLGEMKSSQGPQTILDRLVSFLAATLKRMDLALFRKSAAIPRPVVQKATTIEEREEMAEGSTDSAIPMNERSGPSAGI